MTTAPCGQDNRVVPQTEKFNKTQPITRLTIKSLIRLKEQTDAYRRETDDNDRIINYVILLNLFRNAFTNNNVIFETSKDWETWNRNITALARSLNLWDEVQGTIPWVSQPVIPNRNDYMERVPINPPLPPGATPAEDSATEPTIQVAGGPAIPQTRSRGQRSVRGTPGRGASGPETHEWQYTGKGGNNHTNANQPSWCSVCTYLSAKR